MSTHAQPLALAAPSQRLLAAFVAASLGLALLFVSGFAAPELLHNAAHDWRHAHNFPCH
jgi:cobalt transporter subunit CbtB